MAPMLLGKVEAVSKPKVYLTHCTFPSELVASMGTLCGAQQAGVGVKDGYLLGAHVIVEFGCSTSNINYGVSEVFEFFIAVAIIVAKSFSAVRTLLRISSLSLLALGVMLDTSGLLV